MKVLQIVSHAAGRGDRRGVGGPEKRALEALSWIDRSRFAPVIVYSSKGALFDRFVASGVRVVDFSVRGIEHVAAARTLAGTARDEGVALIHTQGPIAADFYAARAARMVGVPFALTRPSMIEDYLLPFPKRAAYAAVDALTLRSAAAVVAVSEDGRRRLLSKRALGEVEIVLIRNGVDLARHAPRDGAKARILSEVGARPDAATVGMIGQLTDDKGWDVFLETVVQLSRARPGLAAFVIGDGPRRADLELSVAHAGLRGTVFFLGLRDDIPEVLSALDVVLHTSRREGLPVTVIEAMACGRAVVGSDAGGTAELIVPGVTGFVVPVGDVLATSGRAAALLADEALRARMGAAARERAVAEFDIRRMVAGYESLYARLVGRCAVDATPPKPCADRRERRAGARGAPPGSGSPPGGGRA